MALVPLAACLVYWNALGGGFVWDDRFLIVDNPRVQSLERLDELFTHDYVFVAETNLAYGYYRPLSGLSLALDYRAWGGDPFGFHLTNLLLHAAASLLVLFLSLGLGAGRGVAWVTAFLFALHPIHTEAVAWIAGRTDLLAFVFAGASFGLFLVEERRTGDARNGLRWLLRGGSLLCFALALLAKEMAAVVPLWIGAVAFFDRSVAERPSSGNRESPFKRLLSALRATAPWLVILVLYAVARFLVLGVAAPGAPSEHSLSRTAWSAAPTIVRYLGWMAAPSELSAYRQNPYVTHLADPRSLFSLLLLGLGALALRRLARKDPAAPLFAALMLLSFAPILNFVRVAGPEDMGAVMAERFAYFPSFPFLLLAVSAGASLLAHFDSRRARRAVAAGFLLALTGWFGWRTIARNREWRDEVTFFERETARTANAPLLWTNLAQAEMRAGRPAEAERAIRTAERLSPGAPWVLAVRAQWLTLAGRFAEALAVQERVVRSLGPENALALNNRAFLERATGHADRALPTFRQLVSRLPSYPDPWLNIAEIERAEGNVEPAIAAYVRYLDLRPRDLRAVEALAGLFVAEQRFGEAEVSYSVALRGDLIDARIWNNIATVRLAAGDPAGALAAVEKSLAIDARSLRARFNRGKLLLLMGRPDEARELFASLAREAPGSAAGSAAQRELEGAASSEKAASTGMGENQEP